MCGAGTIFSPTKPAPIRPDRPMPRIVSARPVATWLTARPSVITAKIKDSSMPATIPQSAPRMIEPVNQAPPKPHAAPTIIMPSTPRLSTPERSVTSSPVAAINSGVDAASTERMMGSSSSTSAHFPKFVLHLSAHLSRTSESHGHQQTYIFSTAFLFEVPGSNLPLVVQELQIG